MKLIKVLTWALWSLVFTLVALPGLAADYPAPKEGSWVIRDFRFHTGEVLPELRLHYTTVGAPTGERVLILHGTTGSGAGMLTPVFAGELFGPGQPLDASRYYVILPDAIGHGKIVLRSRLRWPLANAVSLSVSSLTTRWGRPETKLALPSLKGPTPHANGNGPH